ncbi:hypothetical protein BD779DRAFT_1537160 [Infundibulicybe gibba]|nr:hypothetical protein BD779DRAFT_1537160 [Infundibulicybe gibba]
MSWMHQVHASWWRGLPTLHMTTLDSYAGNKPRHLRLSVFSKNYWLGKLRSKSRVDLHRGCTVSRPSPTPATRC